VTPEEIHRLVRLSYAAYDRGAREAIFDLFDDDIEWRMFAPPEALPFPNRLRGKAEVLKAIQKVDELVEVLGNDLEVVVVEGDRAAVICDRKLRQRATGRVMRYKVAAFHRYRNSRLIEYMAFADSFDMMQQALGRTIQLPLSYPDPAGSSD
jgi:ketosteroid isomerase-like protein